MSRADPAAFLLAASSLEELDLPCLPGMDSPKCAGFDFGAYSGLTALTSFSLNYEDSGELVAGDRLRFVSGLTGLQVLRLRCLGHEHLPSISALSRLRELFLDIPPDTGLWSDDSSSKGTDGAFLTGLRELRSLELHRIRFHCGPPNDTA